jgi:hypothetical protein
MEVTNADVRSRDGSTIQSKLEVLHRAEKEKAFFGRSLTVLMVGFFGAVLLKQVVLAFAIFALAVPVVVFGTMVRGDFKSAYLDYWQTTGLSAKEASDKYFDEYPPAS